MEDLIPGYKGTRWDPSDPLQTPETRYSWIPLIGHLATTIHDLQSEVVDRDGIAQDSGYML